MTYSINAQNQRYQACPGNYSGVTINVTNPSLTSGIPNSPAQVQYQAGFVNPQVQVYPSVNPQPQAQQVSYPAEYYVNNYNQPPQVVYNTTYQNQQPQAQPQPQPLPQQQTQSNAVGGYLHAPQGGQVQNAPYAPYGYPTSMMPPQNQYSAPMQNSYPAHDFEQEENLASSKEVLAKLDKLIEIEQKQQLNKSKKEVVVLTDEYIMSIENFLNNPNKEIRRKGASEVINRFGEDKTRRNDPALNALLNKMIQDPDKGVRTLAISAISSGIASGNALTVQLLKHMEANPQMYPDDVEQVAMALLKMSASTETIYVDASVKSKK